MMVAPGDRADVGEIPALHQVMTELTVQCIDHFHGHAVWQDAY
jgi:hypothetical protein